MGLNLQAMEKITADVQMKDLKWVEVCARQVAKFSSGHTIVVEKSTLPVKTAEVIQKILDAHLPHQLFQV